MGVRHVAVAITTLVDCFFKQVAIALQFGKRPVLTLAPAIGRPPTARGAARQLSSDFTDRLLVSASDIEESALR
jgi:hypothetical protein